MSSSVSNTHIARRVRGSVPPPCSLRSSSSPPNHPLPAQTLSTPPNVQLHKDGRFPFDKIITYYNSLEEINTAVADVSAGKVVKPVIVMG